MKWLAAVCCRPDLLAVVCLMNWRCANRPLPSPSSRFSLVPLSSTTNLSLLSSPSSPPSSPRHYIYSFLRYNSSGECSSFHPPPLFSFIIVSTGNCHFFFQPITFSRCSLLLSGHSHLLVMRCMNVTGCSSADSSD